MRSPPRRRRRRRPSRKRKRNDGLSDGKGFLKAIVGMGNPGKKYEKTRHNIGFRVVDSLKKEDIFKKWPEKVLLRKPATFVNRTGTAVAELVRRHRLRLEDMLLVCDDVNLDFGKLRLRQRGSSGGHHGLQSVIEALESEEFPRLRVGVKTENMPEDLAPFVLEDFSPEEEKRIGPVLKKAVGVCESWVKEGVQAAFNRLSQ